MQSNTWLEYFGIFISIFIFVWTICFCMKNCKKKPQTRSGSTIAYGSCSTFDPKDKKNWVTERGYSEYIDGV